MVVSLRSFQQLALRPPSLRPYCLVNKRFFLSTPTTKMINFAKGHPNRHLLPVQEVQEIFHKVAVSSNESRLAASLNYPRSDLGHSDLLEELRSFLHRWTLHDDHDSTDHHDNYSNEKSTTNIRSTHHHNISTHLFMTHGVSHGLDMLCTALTKPGDVVWMERPTYFLAAGIFQSHGLQVQSMPMNQRGVDWDHLEHSLQTGDVVPPRMIYCIPTHQNPTARVMPLQDRQRVVKLARKYGILVVADEVYHLLDWRDTTQHGPRPARMAVIDCHMESTDRDHNTSMATTTGCCVSVSSFTKIFAPGVRCGWIEGPRVIIDAIEQLGYIQSQGGCTPMVGEIMRMSLSEGIADRVLDKLNSAYRQRSQQLYQILSSEHGIHFDTEPLGGYFAWISFDGIDDTGDFLTFCVDRGIRFLPGERCDVSHDDTSTNNGSRPSSTTSTDSTDCRRWARVCFADLDLNELEAGAHRMVQVYREYIDRQST